MRHLLLVCFLIPAGWGQTQTISYKGGPGGTFSLGLRTTASLFNDDSAARSMGTGGQFRLRFSERVNSEWFFDYLPATDRLTRRKDFHIGWSVMYYPFTCRNERWMPYVLAGHCFDYTRRTEIADRSNSIDRWSSAVQAGIGTHLNLTERLDLSFSGQYMIHLGTAIHAHTHGNDDVHLEQEKGGAFEGHLLFTVSFNYKLTDLWGRD